MIQLRATKFQLVFTFGCVFVIPLVFVFLFIISLFVPQPPPKYVSVFLLAVPVAIVFSYGSVATELIIKSDGQIIGPSLFRKKSIRIADIRSIDIRRWNRVNNIKTDVVTKYFKQGEFVLTTIAGGEQTPFLAKLPAGKYRFEDVYKNGFTAWRGYAGKYFNVEAGQITYMGRLVVVMPKYPGNWC